MMYQNGYDNGSNVNTNHNNSSLPYVLIIEQPASKSVKFRYKSEPSRGGLIFGAKSTLENKSSFPKIRIVGYNGPAWVRVTCVTIDKPYRTHPHNLVGKKYCSEGICQIPISHGEMIAEFPNLGVQCVKKNDVEKELKRREEKNVDPFKVGFKHRNNVSSVNLNAVRLCFEVFILTADMQTWMSLEPVVSDPIYDKKAMSDLVITKLSHSSASVKGGQEMILLCEKVIKDDIVIRFFDESLNWEDFGIFEPEDVHKQVAIYFKTPPYCDTMITQKVKVNIQLRRKIDMKVTSESRPFFFVPDESDVYKWERPTPSSKAVDTKNHQYLDIHGLTNQQPSNGKLFWIDSNICNGPPSGMSLSHSSASYFPENNQNIADQLASSNSQLHSSLSLDHEPTIQLPPIRNILMRRNKQANNVNEQNFIFPTDPPARASDLFDENLMSVIDCDRPTITDPSHCISENNPLPPSTFLERLEETRRRHSNVFDFHPHVFHADPLFSFHHPFKSMDCTSAGESGCPNSGNGISLDNIADFKDLIPDNNMEALSETLNSSLSMST